MTALFSLCLRAFAQMARKRLGRRKGQRHGAGFFPAYSQKRKNIANACLQAPQDAKDDSIVIHFRAQEYFFPRVYDGECQAEIFLVAEKMKTDAVSHPYAPRKILKVPPFFITSRRYNKNTLIGSRKTHASLLSSVSALVSKELNMLYL